VLLVDRMCRLEYEQRGEFSPRPKVVTIIYQNKVISIHSCIACIRIGRSIASFLLVLTSN
jgi:hypothetical protein